MPQNFTIDDLRDDYLTLFNSCKATPQGIAEGDPMAKFIESNRARYEAVGDPLGIPWFFIGVLQCMECDPPRFKKHLHNGDPLTAPTVQEPKNRPSPWNPPNDWETSATDALRFEGFADQDDWSLEAILFRLEQYNGFAYRRIKKPINTPYLWSFSNHYAAGKFIADHVYSPTAVSNQCGAAVILRRLTERGSVKFDMENSPIDDVDELEPLVTFSKKKSEAARQLQEALNAIPGIFVHVDGIPGRETSDALMRVTGHHLIGDPRDA